MQSGNHYRSLMGREMEEAANTPCFDQLERDDQRSEQTNRSSACRISDRSLNSHDRVLCLIDSNSSWPSPNSTLLRDVRETRAHYAGSGVNELKKEIAS